MLRDSSFLMEFIRQQAAALKIERYQLSNQLYVLVNNAQAPQHFHNTDETVSFNLFNGMVPDPDYVGPAPIPQVPNPVLQQLEFNTGAEPDFYLWLQRLLR